VLRTDWAPTVLVSLQPISTKYSCDADAGSTFLGQSSSVQFMYCEHALIIGNESAPI